MTLSMSAIVDELQRIEDDLQLVPAAHPSGVLEVLNRDALNRAEKRLRELRLTLDRLAVQAQLLRS